MNTLRELRDERFMSQRDLAVAAGVIPKTVNALENGQRVPTFKVIKKIAFALGVEPGIIIFKKPTANLVSLPNTNVVVTQSEKRLEERIAWLELAVKDLSFDFRELMNHTIALERRLGYSTDMTLILKDKVLHGNMPANTNVINNQPQNKH